MFVTGTFLLAAEHRPLPDGAGTIVLPDRWHSGTPGVLIGPGPAGEAPRLALAVGAGAPAATASTLRDAWRRVADGCELLDEDDEPLGGRVWRRLRARFAIGPLVTVQTAWVGTVDGRTVVAIYSATEEHAAEHLPAAVAAVASISAPPPRPGAAPR